MREIIISRENRIRMIEHCKSMLPSEACGVLLGTRLEEKIRIAEVRPVKNVAAEANRRFELDPQDWIPLLYGEGFHEGVKAIGLFHSHPRTPPLPSVDDLNTLWHTLECFVILSFQRPEHPRIKAYRYSAGVGVGTSGSTTCSYDELPLIVNG